MNNDSKNLAKLPQQKTVKFTWEPVACSSIRLSKAMVDSSLSLAIIEKFYHQQPISIKNHQKEYLEKH